MGAHAHETMIGIPRSPKAEGQDSLARQMGTSRRSCRSHSECTKHSGKSRRPGCSAWPPLTFDRATARHVWALQSFTSMCPAAGDIALRCSAAAAWYMLTTIQLKADAVHWFTQRVALHAQFTVFDVTAVIVEVRTNWPAINRQGPPLLGPSCGRRVLVPIGSSQT